MPIIRPISDLRNKASDISDIVHGSNNPVFITRNGEGDMVMMSIVQYSRLQQKVDLMTKLAVAQADYAKGDRGRSLADVVSDLKARIDEQG